MKFTVGYNWDEDLIEKLKAYPEVESLYSGISNGVIGGGRAPLVIKDIDEEQIKKRIKKAHDNGLEFDFTLNSGCTANLEFTKEGNKEIREYIEWIDSLGVDSVTVTLPSLISIIKKFAPRLKVKISTFQRITSVQMAKRFEDLGADTIMLSENCNRDFKLLAAIRKAVKCRLALIANVGCLYYCQNAHSHIVSTSHSGTKKGCNSLFTAVPYTVDCLQTRLRNISEFIKVRFIRPEDVAKYEEIGIDLLKICDRHTKSEVLLDRVKAYHERSYEGNLLYLLGQKSDRNTDNVNVGEIKRLMGQSKEAEEKIKYFFGSLNVPISDLIYIDNKKIPSDFLEQYEKRDCTRMSCDQCGYCKSVTDIAVTTAGDDKIKEVQYKLKILKGNLVDGSILY